MNNVLVISKAETFTIKGMEMKLNGIGVKTYFSTPKTTDLANDIDKTKLFVLCTDEEVSDITAALVYLKDQCEAEDKQVIVVGTKVEYDIVRRTIPEGYIKRFFDRPLDMEGFLDEVELFFARTANKERRKSILIVDDDVQYMSMVSDWLKDGYRVSKANSGVSAITWLATNHADLILLDYEMPITPGPQVMEMLRENEDTADIPIFFLTGNNDRESILKVIDLRPADYILKAIDKRGLKEKLDKYFIEHPVK